MNVLLIHEFGMLGALAGMRPDTPLNLALRKVGAPDLAQRIAEADLIAVAAATSAARHSWAEVQQGIAARDIPVAMLRLLPSRLFDAQAMSGSCAMHRARDGSSEVACWIQQQALSQIARLAERDMLPLPLPDNGSTVPPGTVTRFTFQGD